MKKKPSLPCLALVGLLIFLLTGQSVAQGYVWCIGEDGHVALEWAAGEGCGPATALPEQDCHFEPAPGLSAGEEHCGPCLDLQVSSEAASRRQSEQVPHDFLPVAELFQTSVLPALQCLLTTRLYPQPPPRVATSILAQRTVVLLI